MESFIEYCKNYIIDHIEDYEGQSHYACDWGSILTEGANCDGTLTYSTEKAKEYLKEWWYDCGQYFEYDSDHSQHHDDVDRVAEIICPGHIIYLAGKQRSDNTAE